MSIPQIERMAEGLLVALFVLAVVLPVYLILKLIDLARLD